MKFNSHCPSSSEEQPFENIDRQFTYDFSQAHKITLTCRISLGLSLNALLYKRAQKQPKCTFSSFSIKPKEPNLTLSFNRSRSTRGCHLHKL